MVGCGWVAGWLGGWVVGWVGGGCLRFFDLFVQLVSQVCRGCKVQKLFGLVAFRVYDVGVVFLCCLNDCGLLSLSKLNNRKQTVFLSSRGKDLKSFGTIQRSVVAEGFDKGLLRFGVSRLMDTRRDCHAS